MESIEQQPQGRSVRNIVRLIVPGLVLLVALVVVVMHLPSNDLATYNAPLLGFSFKYPDSLTVEIDTNNPDRLMIYPKSLKANSSEPMTAVMISTSPESSSLSIEDWMNSPNSGYDASRDGAYSHRVIGGQDALETSDEWAVLKSPDGKRLISIAYFVDQKNGAKPLHQELQTILDTFSFR